MCYMERPRGPFSVKNNRSNSPRDISPGPVHAIVAVAAEIAAAPAVPDPATAAATDAGAVGRVTTADGHARRAGGVTVTTVTGGVAATVTHIGAATAAEAAVPAQSSEYSLVLLRSQIESEHGNYLRECHSSTLVTFANVMSTILLITDKFSGRSGH